ncbi:C-type lectin domain family 7 member A-like [Erinaceus europaeus]|uniref:C-type lectin domain family 7 member A-like n=1 Tax=Erinaceus europaeus TaxID=9365 RepID=A0ABM3XKY5_ERIEU|nr:C-type lectin domain family 7 member A-like [Erinaceus europaeus]
MSELIYSNLKFPHSSKPKRRQKAETTKRKEHPVPSSPWRVIAVVLGIICLLLMLSWGLFAALRAFGSQETDSNQEYIRNYPTCPDNWHQYGKNCYHFARNLLPWKECDSSCTDLKSRFLKLDTEEEMNFLKKLSKMQCNMQNEKFFISLSYNSKQLKWTWGDGTDLTLNKFCDQSATILKFI